MAGFATVRVMRTMRTAQWPALRPAGRP